jgi:hypothetical protein
VRDTPASFPWEITRGDFHAPYPPIFLLKTHYQCYTIEYIDANILIKLEFIVLMQYAFGVPVDILSLTLIVIQISIAMKGECAMIKNSFQAGIVCACGVAKTVLLKRH